MAENTEQYVMGRWRQISGVGCLSKLGSKMIIDERADVERSLWDIAPDTNDH